MNKPAADGKLEPYDRSPMDEARSLAHRSKAPPAECAGAIAVTRDGSRFPGVAIALSSAAGLSVCAERVAMSSARSATSSPIEEIALWIPKSAGDHPCGICLQIWLELAPKARFLLQRGEGEIQELDLKQLLPDAFTSYDPSSQAETSARAQE
ncbi:MAG: cytidine deaminase [Candidatus Eisenbacteria sp.]|nr:cytidine deaminase [Candidatus Eisenbacteria bacterium]